MSCPGCTAAWGTVPAARGLDAGGMAPEELLALMRSDIPRLGKVVRDSGAKPD